jgi:putative ABC transport system permease protein
MLADLRFALRRLRLAPGFTALAVAMLGLGIGATTTVFTLINTVLLQPPGAVREPERLHQRLQRSVLRLHLVP